MSEAETPPGVASAAGREAELDASRLPFTDHLRELRTRTIRAVAYVAVAFGVAWVFHEQIFFWLMEPYLVGLTELEGAEADPNIAFRGVIEPIVVYLKTSLLVGFLAVVPLVLLEVWLFVAPGLYRAERRYAAPFLIASVFFFLGGVAFCRYLVLEPALTVLLAFGGDNTEAVIMMQEYFSFTSMLLTVFGVMFELPVVTSFATLIGLLDYRDLVRNWKFAVVGAFVLGAMFTPPDPLTQAALAVPMVVLYGLSIAVSYLLNRDGRPRLSIAPDPDELAAP